MPSPKLTEYPTLPFVILLKSIARFIKCHKRICAGIVILFLLIPVGIRGRIIYYDHNPHYNLIKVGTYKISSIQSRDGGVNTYFFRVPNNWGIAWTYNCNDKPSDFTIGIYDTNNRLDPNEPGPNPGIYGNGVYNAASGSGLQIEPSKGVYEVEVVSSICSWTVNIEPKPSEKPFEIDTPITKCKNDPQNCFEKKSLSPRTNIAPSTKNSSAAPTASLASLNSQSVGILTPVLTNFEQQMSQGQEYASQSNAGDVSSDFHTWETAEQDKENVSNNNEEVYAYNKADNAYYTAHQTAPDALSNWDNDAGNIPGDISQWANAEELVAEDSVTGSSSLSSDQQAATTALQQYQSDLAKAEADISQL